MDKSECSMRSMDEERKIQDLEIRETLKHIKHKILVMSGKGGVGKSSVAAYLAVALAKRGARVGLMDVDLHGPSIPRLLGLKGGIGPGSTPGKAKPVQVLPSLEVISIEALMGEDKDRATIWRGPLKIGVIRQFISDIEWDALHYLIIDSPPGTGDEPLTVAQTIPDAQALIVTTPQEISLADVRKSINFCRTVDMRILGLVENMGAMRCPHCGGVVELFKAHGGERTARSMGLRFLGTLPLDPEVVTSGDAGNMDLLEQKTSTFATAFAKIVDQITRVLATKAVPTTAVSETQARSSKGNGRLIVVPVSNGRLSSHFGHCEQFAFIKTDHGEIKKMELKTPPPHEPGVIPRWLHEEGADVVITGGIGAKAQELLTQNGIEVITGAPEEPPESLARSYLSRSLVTGENVCDH